MLNKTDYQKDVKVWLLAMRPKTLPAAAAGVVVGSGIAFEAGKFQLLPALAAMLTALLLQIGANLANDVFDFQRGADAHNRLGPLRVTQSGLLTPEQVLTGMWVVFGTAVMLGVYLTWVGGWPVILMGVAAICVAIVYTGGPIPLGYLGLGDILVFLFFGPIAVCGTYFIQAGAVSRLSVWASIPMGLLIVAILVVNNLRDIETDRTAGKRTLAVRLGVQKTRLEYSISLFVSYLIPFILGVSRMASLWCLLSWLTLPLAISLVKAVWQQSGRQLNNVLAGTGRLVLLYGVLFAVGLNLY